MSTKPSKETDSTENQYYRALELLDDTAKYLKKAEVNVDMLRAVGRIVKYLRGKSSSEIHTILGDVNRKKETSHSEIEHETDEQISKLTAEQLGQRLADPMLTRKTLERIAKVRFGVSTGALSTLRDKKSLHEKLLTMIANEVTHDSIAKLAGNSKLLPD